MKNKISIIILTTMILFPVLMSGAIADNPAWIPSSWQMGSFAPPSEYLKAHSIDPNAINQWFRANFSINQAYQVGASSNPYQFLVGNFYQNGQNAPQEINVYFQINWGTGMGFPFNGAPTGWSFDPQDYGVNVFFIQGNNILMQHVDTSPPINPNGWINYTASFVPTSAQNGSFYIEFDIMLTPSFWWASAYWVAVMIGEGEYSMLNAHTVGTPTTVVSDGGKASITWAFNEGSWTAQFIHFKDNDPTDNSPSNIQVLMIKNFNYIETGGIETLSYTFPTNASSGVYAWQFSENFTHYGSVFIVYNNASVTHTPPMISISIIPRTQGENATIYITARDQLSTTIDIMVTIWYGNDQYTVPDPAYANVIYYFKPYILNNGQTINISIYNSFYGNLNVEVLSENSYNAWNNSYASALIKAEAYQNGTPPVISQITLSDLFATPIASPLNILLFFIGIAGLFFESKQKRPNYMLGLIFIGLSFINWGLIGISI